MVIKAASKRDEPKRTGNNRDHAATNGRQSQAKDQHKVQANAQPPIAHAEPVEVKPQPVAEAGEPLRDPVRLNGDEIVSYVKQLSVGDDGYNPNEKMVLVQKADLSTQVVPLTAISKDATPRPEQRSTPDRVNAEELPKT